VCRGRILKTSRRSIMPPFIGKQSHRQAACKAVLLSTAVIVPLPLPLPLLNPFCTSSFLSFICSAPFRNYFIPYFLCLDLSIFLYSLTFYFIYFTFILFLSRFYSFAFLFSLVFSSYIKFSDHLLCSASCVINNNDNI
jgi:hypothetical protein